MNDVSCAKPGSARDLDDRGAGAWVAYHRDREDQAARNTLLMIYRPLAERAAASEFRAKGPIFFLDHGMDADDLKQLSLLCLLDLLQKFDPTLHSSFTLYASPLIRLRIKGAIRDTFGWVKRQGRRKGVNLKRVSGDAPMIRNGAEGPSDEPYSQFDFVEAHGDSPTLPAELIDFRDSILSKLSSERDRTIFSLKFLGNLSNAQIGKYLHRSESTVSIDLQHRIIPAIAEQFPDAPPGVQGRLNKAFRSNAAE